MVRVGTLPFRMVALASGADCCYGPEEIDRKVATWTRTLNSTLKTVDFVNPKSSAVDFRIHSIVEAPSKRNFVFQMGTSDPEWAVKAARVIQHDVSAIDINCGCPKHFSVSGGMGAALLEDPDRLVSILTALVQNFPHLAITCKIRLLPNIPSSIPLFLRLQSTGVRAITVHFRTRYDRPSTKAHWDMVSEILRVARVPVIVNGDIYGWESVQTVKRTLLESLRDERDDAVRKEMLDKINRLSFMPARGAISNPSIFRQIRAYLDASTRSRDIEFETAMLDVDTPRLPPLTPVVDLARLYVRLAAYFEHPGHPPVKYTLGQMVPPHAPRIGKGKPRSPSAGDKENYDSSDRTSAARSGSGSRLGPAWASFDNPVQVQEHEGVLREISGNDAATMTVTSPPPPAPAPATKAAPKETICGLMYPAKSMREVCAAFDDDEWYDRMVEGRQQGQGLHDGGIESAGELVERISQLGERGL
ncbi:FMN-linked oxidoreductase [Gonapodya prolifera JEL478]|uniref:FMN-linked oxidoreductase n=1 Tax=Gonapodya prolifera (strain JEL478) TaxID=1344416 RepID=A0A139A9S3_GONPJ|nr:FMN-linked oxidoreductase [Gonapodya prolifera JEL478]|eukprot:KXS13591.1 FMN-linked oxidoreductase [Gonapodya prolifera JEL478]